MLRISVRLAFTMLGLVAAPVLHGCTDRLVNRVEVPPVVQQMMGADFPADGQVHARVRGRFRIEPATAFCTFRTGHYVPTELLNERLRQIGQNPMHGGSLRTTYRANVSKECFPDRSVFMRAVSTPNRQGRPYRVVLAVWQGDSACVGAIERSDGRRPGVRVTVPDIDLFGAADKQTQERSIGADLTDLSRVCLARFSGNVL